MEGRVQRGTRAAGGFLDIIHDRINAELKVAKTKSPHPERLLQRLRWAGLTAPAIALPGRSTEEPRDQKATCISSGLQGLSTGDVSRLELGKPSEAPPGANL